MKTGSTQEKHRAWSKKNPLAGGQFKARCFSWVLSASDS
jgi:hypothetical protein